MNNTAGATAIAAPCVQNVPTPVGNVPIPSVNNMTTVTATPNVTNIIYGGSPIVNQSTKNKTSVGSIPSGGLITAGLNEDSQNNSCSAKLSLGGAMATSMGDATGHNKKMNSFSVYMVPSPPAKWIVLS